MGFGKSVHAFVVILSNKSHPMFRFIAARNDSVIILFISIKFMKCVIILLYITILNNDPLESYFNDFEK